MFDILMVCALHESLGLGSLIVEHLFCTYLRNNDIDNRDLKFNATRIGPKTEQWMLPIRLPRHTLDANA